jgi:predicted RNase H-like HicB family nuclease
MAARRLTSLDAAEVFPDMKQLTAIIHAGEADEGGFWATCLEVPGANGQGETEDACLRDLAAAVQLLVATEREEAMRGDPTAREVPLAV